MREAAVQSKDLFVDLGSTAFEPVFLLGECMKLFLLVCTAIALNFIAATSGATEKCQSEFKSRFNLKSKDGTYYVTRRGTYEDPNYPNLERHLRFILCDSQDMMNDSFKLPKISLPIPTDYLSHREAGLEALISLTENPGRYLLAWGFTDFPESTHTCSDGPEPRTCKSPRQVYLSVQALGLGYLQSYPDKRFIDRSYGNGFGSLANLPLPNGSRVKSVKLLSNAVFPYDQTLADFQVKYQDGSARILRYRVTYTEWLNKDWSIELEFVEEL